MPFICIGPVCIPWTAIAPIMIWALRPLWNRLPPHVQSAISTRAEVVQEFVQKNLWDRIGWKAKPKKAAEPVTADAAATAAEKLREGMGGVVSLHTGADWQAALELTRTSDVALVVDFTATWCGPCQRIAPFFALLAAKHPTTHLFVKVDVDELEDVSADAGVAAMPTFQLYENGKCTGTATGASDDKLEKLVESAAGLKKAN